MIDTCAEPHVSYLSLVLDTRPPKLTIAALPTVEPPDDWVVTITSDEVIGRAEFVFFDTVGTPYSIGYVMLSDFEIELHIPTAGLGQGEAQLTGWVEDSVSNRTLVSRLVSVLRPRAFDVVLTISHAFAVSETIDHAYEVLVTSAHGFLVDSDIDHAYEVETTSGHAFSTVMELEHG